LRRKGAVDIFCVWRVVPRGANTFTSKTHEFKSLAISASEKNRNIYSTPGTKVSQNAFSTEWLSFIQINGIFLKSALEKFREMR
jgi:hypothetical protein